MRIIIYLAIKLSPAFICPNSLVIPDEDSSRCVCALWHWQKT